MQLQGKISLLSIGNDRTTFYILNSTKENQVYSSYFDLLKMLEKQDNLMKKSQNARSNGKEKSFLH